MTAFIGGFLEVAYIVLFVENSQSGKVYFRLIFFLKIITFINPNQTIDSSKKGGGIGETFEVSIITVFNHLYSGFVIEISESPFLGIK